MTKRCGMSETTEFHNERVARMMFQKFFEIGAEIGITEPPIPWDDARPLHREAWMRLALATIEALK
jgi:hypothetical protein